MVNPTNRNKKTEKIISRSPATADVTSSRPSLSCSGLPALIII